MRLLIALAFLAGCKSEKQEPPHLEIPTTCADYRKLISQVELCSRIPGEVRTGLASSFRKLASSWTDGAMTPDRHRAFDAACKNGMEATRLAARACFEVEAAETAKPPTAAEVEPLSTNVPAESSVAGKLSPSCEELRVSMGRLVACSSVGASVREQFAKAYSALEAHWRDFDKQPADERAKQDLDCKRVVDELKRLKICNL